MGAPNDSIRILVAMSILKEGFGYDLIYETLLTSGKSKPIIIEGDDYVEVSVFRKIITKDAMRVCDYISDHFKLKRKSFIALGVILQHKSIYASELSKELQLPAGDRLRPYVDALLSNNIILSRGKSRGVRYDINPEFVANTKIQFATTLKTIEPYRLKALICEDLRFHPNSLLSEISTRLPDVLFPELEKMVREMAKKGELKHTEGRKYRRYSLL